MENAIEQTTTTREDALKKIISMKGKEFIIDNGDVEIFETGSVAPKGGKILMMTNKTTRITNLTDFHEHIKLYAEHKRTGGDKSLLTAASVVQPTRSGASVILPAHIGDSKDVIHFTTDYTLFKNIKGNRDINEAKVNRIIKDINSGLNLLPFCPIIIDADFNIIDGQHRFEVCLRIKSPVWFIVARKLTLHEIAKVNSSQERWKTKDFINCYANQNNQHYIKLRDFMAEYDISVSIAINLLMSGKNAVSGHRIKDAFEAGDFQVITEEQATRIMEHAKIFNTFKNWRSGAFIQAIVKLLEADKCDWKHLKKKFESIKDAIPPCTLYKEYLAELERIYNHHGSTRKSIY